MRPLIVLGASVRAAANSAQRAGFAPYAIDLFADRDLAALCPAAKISRFPGEFLPALADAPVAPWIYTGGLENYPRLVERLARLRPLLGNGGDVLRRVRDPHLLAKLVQLAGFRSPQVVPATQDGTSEGAWLLKSRRGSGGLGIHWAGRSEIERPPPGMYLQAHVAGEPVSAVFVGQASDARLVGATRQLCGSDFSLVNAFLYAGSIGPLQLSDDEEASLCRLGNTLARQFGLRGLFNADFVRNEAGWWLLEVNPRYTASIEVLERALPVHCVDWHVRGCAGYLTAHEVRTGGTPILRWGKAVVYAREDGVVSPRFDALAEAWNQPGARPTIADLPRVSDVIQAGQPVATVFAEGRTLEAAQQELRARVAAVQATLVPLTSVPRLLTPDS